MLSPHCDVFFSCYYTDLWTQNPFILHNRETKIVHGNTIYGSYMIKKFNKGKMKASVPNEISKSNKAHQFHSLVQYIRIYICIKT